jgi:hypothetical protein
MPIANDDASAPVTTYEYAIIRVVPSVERGEFLNAGVLLSCPAHGFLAAKIELDEARLRALFPEANIALFAEHLGNIERVCAGFGPIGKLAHRARFHWLVAPRSTLIQTSPVHSGFCVHPQSAMNDIFAKMVAPRSLVCAASTRDSTYDR